MMYTLKAVQNYWRNIKKWNIPISLLCSFHFGHCKWCVSSTTHYVRFEFKSNCMFVVGAKPFQQSKILNTILSIALSKYSIILRVVNLLFYDPCNMVHNIVQLLTFVDRCTAVYQYHIESHKLKFQFVVTRMLCINAPEWSGLWWKNVAARQP